MYTLKSIARRGSLLGAAFALVVSAVAPLAPAAFADALNPLTDRSLTLSSSSPGWAYTDGSGNSTYAPPNSGANGQKAGNYFSFKPSTGATVKTFSFQYCTTSAGSCFVPGNDASPGVDTTTTSDLKANFVGATEVGNVAGAGTITVTNGSAAVTGTGTSFLTAVRPGTRITTAGNNTYVVASVASNTSLTLTANAAGSTESGVAFDLNGFGTVVDSATGAVKAVPGYTNNNPKYISGNLNNDPAEAAKGITGSFIVMYNNAGTWTQSTGWTIDALNVNDPTDTRGTNNYIVLTKSAGQAFTSGQEVKVLFFANNSYYITNPGAGAFFVKINTYNQFYDATSPSSPDVDVTGLAPATDANIIDGGVTVANVMNQSIQITTKVLETMQFSVGTVDPNTLNSQLGVAPYDVDSELSTANGTSGVTTKHTPCDTILKAMTPALPANVLKLGNQAAESSLETNHTYSTHSYWRLSSNSSAGATVYYSGHTLANTVGDEIDAIGPVKATPAKGAEQFGLALANTSHWDGLASNDTTGNGVTPEYSADTTGSPAHQKYSVNYAQEATYENGNDNGKTAIHTASLTADGVIANMSWHAPQLYPLVAAENYNDGTGAIDASPTTQFAFDPMSDTIPVALATEDTEVVDCVTGKMRYIANIAATTPAGIYTTKINYIAAPQY